MNFCKNFAAVFFKTLVGAGVAFALINQIARAQPANEPLENFVTTDGFVYAVTETNNVIYLGGSFSSVGPRTGSGVPVSAVTGQAESSYPKINGTVDTAISDGQGGWFVGGTFTLVGGQLHTNLARIRSDRTVDSNWCPGVAGGYVGSLVLSGGTLYAGGSFTNVNGQTRNCLAALDAASGALNSWNPNANATVNTIVISGTNVFVGGEFTTLGGQTRNYIAAVNATTGQPTSWNPGASGSSGSAFVEALLVSNGRLFAGGYFTTIGGQSRSRAASFDLATGLVESWNPNVGTVTIVSPTVFALAAYQNTIFIGGVFSTVGASNRVNIAVVDANTGLPTSWDARADPGFSSGIPVASIQAMVVYNNAVYVGGTLINIGGQPRGYAAALDVNTGDATAWDPKPNITAVAFSGSGNTMYLGGLFSALASLPRTNLAAYDLTSKQVTAWSPSTDNEVRALLAVSNRMYMGGEFTNVCGVTRTKLAAVDLNTGAVLGWAPNPNLYVIALASWNNRLYAGGGFTNISGVARTNLAEFDLVTGALTSWDPALNRAQVRALAVSGNTLYAGGLITTAGGQTRRRLAAFDLTTGLLSPWDAGISNIGAANVECILPYADRVYVGGRFSVVAGNIRTNFVALDAGSAAVLPLVAHTDQPVYALAATSNQVFLGGNFTTVNSQKRSCLASLDANTGQLTSWNPGPDFFVQKLLLTKGVLYPGGVFLRIGGQTSRGIAAFPLSLVGVLGIDSLLRLGDGSLRFRLTALGVPQATVQVSTNLGSWQNLQTVPLVGGTGNFTDSDATNYPRRFYRVSVP